MGPSPGRGRRGVLTGAPRRRGGLAHPRVGVGRQPGVSGGQVAAALGLGHQGCESLPLAGKDSPYALGDPLHLAAGARCDRGQDHRDHLLRAGLGVHQAQGYPPRDPDDHSPLDAEVLTQPLQVGDQMSGGVHRQVRAGVTGKTLPVRFQDIAGHVRQVMGGEALQSGLRLKRSRRRSTDRGSDAPVEPEPCLCR